MKRWWGASAARHVGLSQRSAQWAGVAIVGLLGAAACAGAADRSSAVGGSGGASAGGSGGALAGGSQAGGVAGQFEPGCFDQSRTSVCTPSQAVELANAASFGSGARFRKLGGRAALLDLGADQLPRVVVAREASLNTGTPPVEVLEIDTGGVADLVVTAVWNAAPAPSLLAAETVALACRSSQCELFGASAGATSLVHLDGFDLPAGVKVTDLAAGVVSSDQDFSRHWCAYGEGLFCLSKAGWQTVIPPQTSGTLTAVAIGTPSAAVSSDGRVFVQEGGAWVSHTLPFNDVISVTSAIGIVTVVGSDSVWYLQTSTGLEGRCQSTGALLIAWPGFGLVGDPWRVVSRDGILYQQKSDKTIWCAASTRAPNLLAASAELCGVINNILAISETTFFSMLGPVSCGVS